MIDFNFENNTPIKSGSILISEPFASDDYFERSVIYICSHNEKGSFGFVLNNFIDTKISDFVDDFPIIQTRLSIGGPVDTSNLFYYHLFGEKVEGSVHVYDNIYLGGDFKDVKQLLTDSPEAITKIRFFVGYSGWDLQQLDEEIANKSWIVINDYTEELIFNTSNNDLWKEILQRQGEKFKIISQFPLNPNDN